MIRNGIAYRRVPSAPLTDAIGSGLWPTPQTAYDGRTNEAWAQAKAEKARKHAAGGYARGTGAPGMMDLQRAVNLRQHWPTPTAEDGESKGMSAARLATRAPDNLATAVRMWPTPGAAKASWDTTLTCSGDGRQTPNKLGWAVAEAQRETFPSPAARDWRSGKGRSENGHTPQLPEAVGGQLSADWTGWLMGYPPKWTVVSD